MMNYTLDEAAENQEIVKRYRKLLRTWSTRKSPEDRKIVRKAFDFAVEAHKEQRRKSGEPYIFHPLDVATIAAGDIGLGKTSIICALLHDVVEDTPHTIKDIRDHFGDKVARIIDGLTKIEEIIEDQPVSMQAENFKKMLLTLSDDVRVILIKLADRLHNMRTLDAMKREKRLKIASETQFLYAPLAHRLGLYAIKSELEDLSFKYIEPDIFESISSNMDQSKEERKKFIRRFVRPLRKSLNEQGISYQIFAREKSISSVWTKMKENEISFKEVFDVFAVKVVIDAPIGLEKIDCWKVYSIITDHYRPNMSRLRDWMSTSKANGYEAIHTTVMSHAGQWVEVQIQSHRMNDIAMKGYAAHWKYREGDESDSGLDEWLKRIRELLESNEENALDFLSDFKLNLFSDEIYVFTPKGERKSLPFGATPLDYAYLIHTDVGNTCIGAKINHNLVPMDYKLKNGDQIEVLTSKNQKPKEEWFQLVVTSRAKNRIKHAIREDRRQYRDVGKQRLIQFFEELGIEFSRHNRNIFQNETGYPSSIDLYFHIAHGKINKETVKNIFLKDQKSKWFQNISLPFVKSKKTTNISNQIRENIRKNPEQLLLEGSIDQLNHVIPTCCSPIPGDDVIGLVSPDDVIIVHRINCPVAIQEMSKFGNRIVKAKWEKKSSLSFLAGIKISSIDSVGFINKITSIISNEFKLNIRSFHLETSEGVTNSTIHLYVDDLNSLNELIDKLKNINQIKKINRIDRISEADDKV
ncbi:MAG: RelA/SpoT family protein [Bacteroidetes bacterium]|nr:RelA/SpoT family protein [Bacteroidota bacterium]